MPWLPLYLTETDASVLFELLAQDPEIAFLVPDGPRRWRAVKAIATKGIERVGLWHVPSGPLPLLPATNGDPIHRVQDPWLGWMEERTGANPNTPYFGAGHPGIVWLNLRTSGKDRGSYCGFSSFEWIGNHYKVIGNAAATSTEVWWKSLRRRVVKLSKKVPRQQLSSSSRPEIFAFPCAYDLLEAGGVADANP
jgi:hypothetical protein